MLLNRYVWLVSLFFLLSVCNRLYGQATVQQIKSTYFDNRHEVSFLDSLWFYHAGEMSKQPGISMAGWTPLHHTAFGKVNPPAGWLGTGWFGMWVKVDTALVNKKIALRINHDGASEIFVDGKPIGGYGKVANSAQSMEAIRAPRELIPLWFADTRPHLITLHYSNFFGVYPDFLGFEIFMSDYGTTEKLLTRSNRLFGFVPIFAAAGISLGLLHFLLFLFYPRRKLNLYVALFVLLVGFNGMAVYQYYLTNIPAVQYFAELLTMVCKCLLMWSGVLLLYALDYGKVPRRRFFILSTISAFYLIHYVLLFLWNIGPAGEDYFSVVFFLYSMDNLFSAYHLVKRRQKGFWLIMAGVISVTLVYFFAWADVFGLWPPQYGSIRIFVMSAGNLVLPFGLSLYLALDFSRTNQALSSKLAEVERLSAEAIKQEAEKRLLVAAEARRLEHLVQLRTAELREKAAKLEEMDVAKSRLFINITHEFKTPLTLIINPVKEMLDEPSKANSPEYLNLILNNATRLLGLINQLLDLSKLENGSMEITAEPFDMVALVDAHLQSYRSVVIQKGIVLNLSAQQHQLWVLGDKDKWDKIILNLISNAIKFTDNGRIEIAVSAIGDLLNFTIRDTGRGIDAVKLPHIFSRFYQADPSETRLAGGTGIGLAIVKELVDLLGGQINVQSVEGLFTEFIIIMPYKAAPVSMEPELGIQVLKPVLIADDYEPALTITDDDRPLILLIEDHEELRNFLSQSLIRDYRVLNADDGEKGIALALKHVPTLIITDLMMPRLDGYQVCAQLKQDQRTSHVPIIILTAKSDIDSRIQGIQTGADAYLGKPFDKRELFAHIDNLIAVRSQLRELYSNHESWFKETAFLPSIEQEFIARVRNAVESHLDEEGYSADQLATDLGLSRTQLHRKLKALTGQAPGELIRIVRLQYAHDLLQRRVATVAEVAYMIGFSSPASFSASFSRHFGFTPSKVPEV
jgi:signal transduction histidine kinase/DNA-binding response OmpR family regulator